MIAARISSVLACGIIALFALAPRLGAQPEGDIGGAGAPAAPDMPAAPGGEAGDFGAEAEDFGGKAPNNVRIQYDAESGQLIVITDAETSGFIDTIVKSLDQPVPQVLIKVLFLEVTHTKGSDIGLQAAYTGQKTTRQAGINNLTGEVEPAQVDLATILSDFGLATLSGGGIFTLVNENLELTLRAIADTSKLEVLSRPAVFTRNNQPATIVVGQEVPRITGSRVTDSGQTFNDFIYEDVGIILEVTPTITRDGLVSMEVLSEISTISGETVQISPTAVAPVFAKRSAETRVVVQDGRTVVIGGMMEDNYTETVTKIPLLGDIPLLGRLFQRRIRDKRKTELLIFLTPYVLDSSAMMQAQTKVEYRLTEVAPQVIEPLPKKEKFLDNWERILPPAADQ